ncbi:MAG: winged helix-turn-helix transcriptional regulator [Firmicutes bacterium]|nr:winged helix-turn-helix transcriptional regulator [Bacillota bacterium]
MTRIVDVFKALADMTRLKIYKLLTTREFCVCELAAILGISQSAVSQHLRKLRQVELVIERRSGQWIYYQANPGQLESFLIDFAAFRESPLDRIPEFRQELDALFHLDENETVKSCKPPQIEG